MSVSENEIPELKISAFSLLADLFQLAKPGISLFIALTTATAVLTRASAGAGLQADLWTVVGMLFIATFLLSGGVATFNQYYDVDSDRKMFRTRNRPIPAGRIPAEYALVQAVVLSLLGSYIAYVYAGIFATLYLVLGGLCYAGLYTVILKPRTAWSVPAGGLCGFFAALAGAVSVSGHISWNGMLLAAILYFWSAPHFWALAILSQEDYRRAGIPILPFRPEHSGTPVLMALHAIVLIAVSFGFLVRDPGVFIVSLIAGIFFFTTNALLLFRRSSSRDVLRQRSRTVFLSSLLYLPIIFLSFWINALA